MTSNEPPNEKPMSIGDKSVEDIQSILECPVCYQTPRNPEKIHICSNHHIVCDNCKSKIDKCPVCRSQNFSGKNPLLQKILSALPKSCPFVDEGCEFNKPISGAELNKHLKICQYRLIDCVYNLCNSKIPFLTLSKHIEDNHDPTFIDNKDYHSILVEPDRFTEQDEYDCFSWFPSVIKFDEKLFYVQTVIDDNQMSTQCLFYGTETESKKYFFEIFVENEPSLSRHKLQLNFSGDVISVDIPKASRNDFDDSTFNISNHMAKRLWNKDEEEVRFKITIKHE